MCCVTSSCLALLEAYRFLRMIERSGIERVTLVARQGKVLVFALVYVSLSARTYAK
jgi:hypothetical protein